MYLGIDVGGTKTLVCSLSDNGEILERNKFPTPKNYSEFLEQTKAAINSFTDHAFKAGGAGLPARFNEERDTIINMGNLPWQNTPVLKDLSEIANCPFVIENDGKMGGLSEAVLLKDKYKKVLYVAVGTGIGVALVSNCKIDDNIGDPGGRSLMLEHEGKMEPWEQFAGGRAIFERYGKPAHDIDDDKTWREICVNLTKGLIDFISITEPDVIVIGGSVGSYFERYGAILGEELSKFKLPLVKTPPVVGAQRPEEAVVYGSYELAKQKYGS
jgi:predicted NBD/HSP70 family sugar kinase